MGPAKPWRDLDRPTAGSAPHRYAPYESDDADGNTIGFGTSVIRDELNETLSDDDAVRRELADSTDHAERLLAEHGRA